MGQPLGGVHPVSGLFVLYRQLPEHSHQGDSGGKEQEDKAFAERIIFIPLQCVCNHDDCIFGMRRSESAAERTDFYLISGILK